LNALTKWVVGHNKQVGMCNGEGNKQQWRKKIEERMREEDNILKK
jgi:hypothetical protein